MRKSSFHMFPFLMTSPDCLSLECSRGGRPAKLQKGKTLEERAKAFTEALANAKKRTEEAGYTKVTFREVVDIDPAERIAEQAEHFGVDVIVVGNRGLGTFASLLIGGVSSKLLGLAACPVLVVK